MAEKQFCTFYLGEALFGIDILSVREINRHLEMTKVHKVEKHVRGLLNLRGQIVTILDLGVRLGIGETEVKKESRSIILKSDFANGKDGVEGAAVLGEVGLLVDRIGDVLTVDDSEIESPPANIGVVEGRFMDGVIKMNDDLLSILNIETVCG